jgi:uncharacterized protein YjbI with pentapeptide repeats
MSLAASLKSTQSIKENGMKEYEPKPLSNAELQSILESHKLYNESSGKEGQLANLSAYVIEDAEFSGLDLSEVQARGSIFIRCRFVDCLLYRVYFNNSSLISANFRGALLSKAEFFGANASGACFDYAKMNQAEFIEANLRNATFRNAELIGSIISECDLTGAIFDGANIEHAGIADNTEDGTSWVNVKGYNVAA